MNQSNVRFNYAFLCDNAFMDAFGKLNIIGIFQNIISKTCPFIQPQLYFVSNVIISGKGHYKKLIKIVRKRDNVEIISPLPFELDISEDKEAEFGVIGQLTNIKFEETGTYEVQIFVNDQHIKSLILNVSVSKAK